MGLAELQAEVNAITATATPKERLAQLEKIAKEVVTLPVVAFSKTTAAFTQPNVEDEVTVAVTDTGWMIVGMILRVGLGTTSFVGGTFEVSQIISTTSVKLKLLQAADNSAAGTSVATDSTVTVSAIQGYDPTKAGPLTWADAVDGDDDNAEVHNQFRAYKKIQTAINASPAGTTVMIRRGTYLEDLVGKNGVNLVFLKDSFLTGDITDSDEAVTIWISGWNSQAEPNQFEAPTDTGIINNGANGAAMKFTDPNSVVLVENMKLFSTHTDRALNAFGAGQIVHVRNCHFEGGIKLENFGILNLYGENRIEGSIDGTNPANFGVLWVDDETEANKILDGAGEQGLVKWGSDPSALGVRTITFGPQNSDPDDPPDSHAIMWVSTGAGSGSDGDVMMKITDSGGTTKIKTVVTY